MNIVMGDRTTDTDSVGVLFLGITTVCCIKQKKANKNNICVAPRKNIFQDWNCIFITTIVGRDTVRCSNRTLNS